MTRVEKPLAADLNLRYGMAEEALAEQLWTSDGKINVSVLEILSELAPAGFEEDFVFDAMQLIEDLMQCGTSRCQIARELLRELREEDYGEDVGGTGTPPVQDPARIRILVYPTQTTDRPEGAHFQWWMRSQYADDSQTIAASSGTSRQSIWRRAQTFTKQWPQSDWRTLEEYMAGAKAIYDAFQRQHGLEGELVSIGERTLVQALCSEATVNGEIQRPAEIEVVCERRSSRLSDMPQELFMRGNYLSDCSSSEGGLPEWDPFE